MGINTKPSGDQPLPVTTKRSESVPDAVVMDHLQRSAMGRKKYGSSLHTFNGRNALQDAYEELLDLTVYIKQVLMEERSTPVVEFRYMGCRLVEDNFTTCAYDVADDLRKAIMQGTREATVTHDLLMNLKANDTRGYLERMR